MRYQEIIRESLSKVLPYHWHDKSDDDVGLIHADFQVGEGYFIVQFKMPYYNPGIWELSFTRNGELALSGTGNAGAILATVMQIVREFIKAKDPRTLTFSASVSEPSRSKLYPKLMAILMREFPEFTADEPKQGRKYDSFGATRPARPWVMPPPPPKPEPYEGPEVSFDELEQMLADLDAADRKKRAA